MADPTGGNFWISRRPRRRGTSLPGTKALRPVAGPEESGGEAWKGWVLRFRNQLVNCRNVNGSWPPLGMEGQGAELQMSVRTEGQVYRTTLCILILEAYYRALPPTR